MPRSAKAGLKVLADVLQCYTKIRRIVQRARSSEASCTQLVGCLMSRCSRRDTMVLGEICHRLKQRKRSRQPWGNVTKKDDRLYKLLRASVKIRSPDDQSGIDTFVKESFRCRAICVTSKRFGQPGSLPSGPVPQAQLPYRVYGYARKREGPKHRLWCREYGAWTPLPRLTPYTSRLSEAMLQERCSVGAFVRLQILTDLCHRLGPAFVQLPSGSLGTGVHFGLGVLNLRQLADLKDILNKRGNFRQLWKSCIALHEVGHLVCEARQHIWRHKRKAGVQAFMRQFSSAKRRQKLSGSRSEELSRKRRFCEIIAAYAKPS